MSNLDEQVDTLLRSEESRAPDSVEVMAGVRRGITRQHQRRVAVTGVAVAAAAVLAVAVPLTMQDRTASHGAPATTAATAKPAAAFASTLAPTWLPAGFVETGRERFLMGGATPTWGYTRTWSEKPGENPSIAVTDQPAREAVSRGAGSPVAVTVAGRPGQAWTDHSTGRNDYVVVVKWSAGHWLSVDVSSLPDMPAVAQRVANSVVNRAGAVSAPVTCSVCKNLTVSVTGSAGDWTGSGMADNGTSFIFDRIAAQPRMVTVPLGGGMYAHLQATDPAAKEQPATVAKTVRSTHPDYSWLGTRP